MATTDVHLAVSAVAALERAGVTFAVIHGEDRLVRHKVASDVDLVVDRPVHDLVGAVGEEWRGVGLYPVVVWPYDVGGTGSVFLFTPDAADGVQLDVLFDPGGAGQYGIRSGALLDRREPGQVFPRVSSEAAAVYLLSKRVGKGQWGAATAFLAGRSGQPLGQAIAELTDAETTTRLGRYIAGRPIRSRRTPLLGRLVDRLRSPVGAWVHVEGSPSRLPFDLAHRFRRVLPIGQAVGRVGPLNWALRVAPVRWRPGIAVSSGRDRWLGLRPDVVVEQAKTLDHAAELTVDALSRRHLA